MKQSNQRAYIQAIRKRKITVKLMGSLPDRDAVCFCRPVEVGI